jgi:DNA mismatch endonuclease, patch repair protein
LAMLSASPLFHGSPKMSSIHWLKTIYLLIWIFCKRMGDNLKPEDRRKTMQAVKGKATKLERRLASMLAGMRLKGWRKNVAEVAGKPDVVFSDEKVAIFIDGCFWHGCPHCQRKLPVTNREYWERKIRRNIELAKLHNQKLSDDSWTVIRIWEHEMRDRGEMTRIKQQILHALQGTGNDEQSKRSNLLRKSSNS